ncbi:SPO11 protein, partial [Horornis vulcanius]|nr:SPO11 protein [Horornis vulcanius]
SSEVLEAIENVIQGVLQSLAQKKAPVLTVANRTDWRNIEFKDSVGLQMIPGCNTKQIRSDCPQSARRFGKLTRNKSLDMVFSTTFCHGILAEEGVCIIYLRLYITVFCQMSGLEVKNPGHSEHTAFLSQQIEFWQREKTSQNWFKGVRSDWPTGLNTKDLTSHAKFILIVEKDATFQRLLDDDFFSKVSPCIMITGRGIPDLNTRLLVRKLWDSFQIPIFALMDADPHGVEIMCVYKYGSVSMSFEAHHLTVPSVKWLGLLPSDLERLNICKDALIPFTKQDENKLASILKRPYIACQPLWKKELEIMAASKLKAEIQVLTSLSSDYLSRVYLPNKLQFRGWL